MQFVFIPERVCSKMYMIEVDEKDRAITKFDFKGGCPGNLQGLGRLMRGMTIFDSAALAADYTVETIRLTMDDDSHWYGVKFEKALPMLIDRIDAATGSDD